MMNFFARIGRRCIALFSYLIDLTCFLIRIFSVWQPHRNIRNRAVYSIFIEQLVLNGINAVAIITFLAMVVGVSVASQLVFIIVTATGVKDFVEVLARIVLSEMGPLITSVVMVGRSCSSMVVDLGNAKVAGEIEPLQYLGINVDDYFILPRVLCLIISQVILALYFSAVMLVFGMFFSVLIYDIAAEEAVAELLNLVTIDSLFTFMVKNILFGVIVGTLACFHGLAVKNSPTQVSAMMKKAVVNCVVFLFLLDGYLISFSL